MIGEKFKITVAGWRDDRRVAYFCYEIVTDEKTFKLEETIELSSQLPESLESEKLLRSLHIALAVSYYKSFIPPVIEHPYMMDNKEADFWNKVYLNGLGEFLYKNSLSGSRLAKFTAQTGNSNVYDGPNIEWREKAVLGIGGGKDSIVAGELLKEAGVPVSGFVLATGEVLGQTKAVSDVMNIELNAVKRTIDRQILDINKIDGSYNGHIPISLIFGLVGALVAVAGQSRYIIVANESSASIPQTTWEGSNINHQWSKSLDFERLFQDYLHNYVSRDIHYFSAIRPLSSIAIAKIFSQYPQYFEVFTSDNSLFRIIPESREHPRWSLNSSKSLSSYILLAPWLSDEDLIRTFGRNFLNESSLSELFGSLLGDNGQSVLDCVGTPEELRASMKEVIHQSRFTDSALIIYTVVKQLLHAEPELQSFMTYGEHAIPENIAPKLQKLMEQHL